VIARSTSSSSFSVGNITAAGMSYDASRNAASTVNISRP